MLIYFFEKFNMVVTWFVASSCALLFLSTTPVHGISPFEADNPDCHLFSESFHEAVLLIRDYRNSFCEGNYSFGFVFTMKKLPFVFFL